MGYSKLLCILFCLLGHSYWVQADWAYADIKVLEGSYKPSEKLLLEIRSDNANVVKYTLAGEGVRIGEDAGTKDNGAYRFMMNPNGDVYQIGELDRERKDIYHLTASAFDAEGNEAEDDVELKIIVTDINDEKPVFDVDTLQGTVEEAFKKGAIFMTVKATDADDAENTLNADIRYSINPDDAGVFAVDRDGRVSVVGELDYETNQDMSFRVIAEDGDGNVAGHQVYAEVKIKVTDSNDHAPVFDAMPSKTLSELSPLQTSLYDMFASDIDEGPNKKVYFDITSGNTGGAFEIISHPSDKGKSKGQLQLVKDLDFESGITTYDLTIRAYNKEASNAVENSVIAISILKIKVTDENEAPIFISPQYCGTVTESEEAPEEAEPLCLIEANDLDFNGNQSVTFSVNDPEGWFDIDPMTGQVSWKGAVDREAQSVIDGTYMLKVVATDNYDHGDPGKGSKDFEIKINDINDNPPSPGWGSTEASTVRICEQPRNDTVKLIEASDPDSPVNGPEFFFRFLEDVDLSKWGFRKVDGESQEVISKFTDYGLSDSVEAVELPFTITDSGVIPQTGTSTLTVSICKCNDEGEVLCNAPSAAGFPIAIVIAIIAVLLLIIILIIAAIAYKRRQAAMVLKEPFFDDEDDVRETIQLYQEEGGEEDQEAYDLSALRAPLMEDPSQPVRKEMPLQQAPRQPRAGIPDDIGDYIGEAKDQADGDPSAPPFDSLLVFDYEGAGSDAGSLSSINTATTDGSMDYDYLNNWGPRFQKLADMYNDGSESE